MHFSQKTDYLISAGAKMSQIRVLRLRAGFGNPRFSRRKKNTDQSMFPQFGKTKQKNKKQWWLVNGHGKNK